MRVPLLEKAAENVLFLVWGMNGQSVMSQRPVMSSLGESTSFIFSCIFTTVEADFVRKRETRLRRAHTSSSFLRRYWVWTQSSKNCLVQRSRCWLYNSLVQPCFGSSAEASFSLIVCAWIRDWVEHLHLQSLGIRLFRSAILATILAAWVGCCMACSGLDVRH